MDWLQDEREVDGSCDPWMDPQVWGKQLPVEVLHTILAWLPVRSFCRMRCVSKEWNSFALDRGFKQIVSRIPPPMPFWLVFNLLDQDIVYDTCSETWHKATSFFYTSSSLSDTAFTKKGMITSSGSLLLITTADRQDHSMVVFNPVNKTKRWVPKMPRTKISHNQGIIMDNKTGSYKIYVVYDSMSGDWMRFHLYDSVKNKWEQTGPLMQMGGRLEVRSVVEHGGSMYCLLARLDIHYSFEVYRVGFGKRNWELLRAVMPRGIVFPHLFEHEGHLLLGGGIQGGSAVGKSSLTGVYVWKLEVVSDRWMNIMHLPASPSSQCNKVPVWETEAETHEWKPSQKMPNELVQELVIGYDYFFVANGHYIGVGSKSMNSADASIMRYTCNLTTGLWYSLPVPSRNLCRSTQIEITNTILFEPRLDVIL